MVWFLVGSSVLPGLASSMWCSGSWSLAVVLWGSV